MPPMSNGLLYLLTIGIWGSTWLAIEFQLGVVPPEVSVFYRYVLASALLFGWCVATRRSLAFPAWAHLRFMLLGVLMFSLNYLLTYRAQVHVTSALAAIAFSTMLWMNMINARLFFGVRSDRRAIAGSLLGIAGIVVIFEPQVGDLAWTDATFRGCLLALAGALFASFGNIVSQAAQQRSLPIMATNAWAMGYGALFTGLLALLSGKPFLFERSAEYVLSLLYLSVVGSILAFGAYLTLLGRIGAHRAGYAVVAFPIVAVALSAMFEGLELTPSLLLGVALVIGGNVFVMQGRERGAAATATPVPAAVPAPLRAVPSPTTLSGIRESRRRTKPTIPRRRPRARR